MSCQPPHATTYYGQVRFDKILREKGKVTIRLRSKLGERRDVNRTGFYGGPNS